MTGGAICTAVTQLRNYAKAKPFFVLYSHLLVDSSFVNVQMPNSSRHNNADKSIIWKFVGITAMEQGQNGWMEREFDKHIIEEKTNEKNELKFNGIKYSDSGALKTL